ncbi:MAG: sensor histidine kinase [Microscillaceae bacterium]|nr:sensor histidine kinase [Microscillaceae bacterium]
MKKNSFILLITLLLTASLMAQNKTLPIEQGVLDLRQWDFAQQAYLNLDGNWEFYYGVFLSEADLKQIQTKNYLQVPAASWEGPIHQGKKVDGYGFATYHLRVLLPKNCPRLALKTIDQSTAYHLYVNGQLIGKRGQIGKTAAQHIPNAEVGIFTFDASQPELAITIHISNFSHRKGGLWHSWQLGTEAQIYQIREQALVTVIFLCGSLFIMGIYHILLYVVRPRDASIFYFAILCFILAWRVTTTNEVYLNNLLPGLSFEWKSKLEYLSTFMVSPFLATYLRLLFPEELSKKIVWAIHGYIWSFAILIFIFPTTVFSYFILPYYFFLVFVIIVFIGTIIQAIRRGRKGSHLFLFGIVFLAITVINDALHSAVLINTLYLTPFGFLVFFLSQASFLAIRSSDAFNQVEILSTELQTINLNLEKRVASRTQELAELNADLNLKNQKLAESNSIKDKLFSIIAHDFRAPLNSLKGVFELLRYDALSPEDFKNLVAGISKNLNYTTNLLDNLLFWASSQLKGIEPQVIACDLGAIVQENIDLLSEIATQKQVKLTAHIAPTLQVWADVNMLRLILRNLIANAIKFSLKDTQIEVSAQIMGDFCQISVKDEGVGIDLATQAQLFQLDDKKIKLGTAKEKGTGLGLLLCKEFVEKNGGIIWVESTLGEGAIFKFTLPNQQPS